MSESGVKSVGYHPACCGADVRFGLPADELRGKPCGSPVTLRSTQRSSISACATSCDTEAKRATALRDGGFALLRKPFVGNVLIEKIAKATT
jgi:hypothetical protein